MLVRKKAVPVLAWRLGDGSDMEQALCCQGKIRCLPDGRYAVCSQEAKVEGQLANAGDYFKVDATGLPYPNDRAWFEANHTHLEGDRYLQKTRKLPAWTLTEPMPPEVAFLVENGQLKITPPGEHTFSAHLWGTDLTAPEDAVIVLDAVARAADGAVLAVDFHFIVREEFERTYEVIEAKGFGEGSGV